MNYIDGCVLAVPTANKAAYLAFATEMATLFKAHGALQVSENWGSDVPDGKLTSMPMAVQKKPDETVVYSWIMWPSKAARDQAWEKIMQDPSMNSMHSKDIFDGKRMIFGGFEQMLNV